MKLLKSRFPLLVLLAGIYFNKAGANDSCALQISLLTCSPGKELYSTFGHSAIRLKDPNTNTDIVFNYGTFDFDAPNFYGKFIRGKLDYFLSVSDYTDFLNSYKEEKRSVSEQILNLSCVEKQKLQTVLQRNLLPENRKYRYDFIRDNCTTRIRDILLGLVDTPTVRKLNVPRNTTPRRLIHAYLEQGEKQWSELGIDILLGSNIDPKLSASGTMFLPEYLMKGADIMTIGKTKPLVHSKQELLQYSKVSNAIKVNTPLLVFCFISLAISWVYLSNRNRKSILIRLFDTLLFGVTGLTGVLLCFMWWGTDHVACSNNYNLLWALPFNLIAVPIIGKGFNWIKFYCFIVATIEGVLLLFWYWLPQQLNIAIVPVVLLLFVRSLQIARAKCGERKQG